MKSKFKQVFTWLLGEKDSDRMSVRKFLAFLIGLAYTFHLVYYVIEQPAKELHATDVGIIGGVILFYFGKEAISKLKVTSK